MKRYLILIAYEWSNWDTAANAERREFIDGHAAFSAYVAEHGRELGSAALADPDQATTLRRDGDRVVISDGPFAETVEGIGGYYDVELPDLDAAIAAARLLPPAYTLEIRPTVRVT